MYSSAALQRQLYLMASKRLRQLAGTGTRSIATESSAVNDSFSGYKEHLTVSSALNDSFSGYKEHLKQLMRKRQRVVKASLDITTNSKEVIFAVQRINKVNKEKVLELARKDLLAVKDQFISRLVNELQGTDFWELRQAYSPGVQEYVEATTLFKFCTSGTLMNLEEINATLLPLSAPSLEPFQINTVDYMLGVADLTGELMRLAFGRILDGELESAKKICRFMREIYVELTVVGLEIDDSSDMKKKMDTMLQSVMKIENACFNVHMRGLEYIRYMGTDATSYPLWGLTDFDQ